MNEAVLTGRDKKARPQTVKLEKAFPSQVVVVYDITSERSFLNAREWLENAVDGAGREVSLMLLGNKLDQVEDDLFR